MRCFKDSCGAVFDVLASDAQKFEDIFTHEMASKPCDFKVSKATELPELKEDGYAAGRGGSNN